MQSAGPSAADIDEPASAIDALVSLACIAEECGDEPLSVKGMRSGKGGGDSMSMGLHGGLRSPLLYPRAHGQSLL